jgi:phage terminase large subunit-like protein
VFATETRLSKIKAGLGPRVDKTTDRSPWDWYARSCVCGVPPGDCRAHARARTSQQQPAGDWRVWAYVAGRGAGKTRAGVSWVQHHVESGAMKLGCMIAPTSADIRDEWID